MSPKKKNDFTPEEFEQLKKDAEWKKTMSRLGLGEVDVSQVSPQDIAYLAEKWQFLQVVATGGHAAPLENPEQITAKSGWPIINYGDAMATSPGRLLFGGGYRSGDDDDDEGGGGVGTFHKQAFDTAFEVMERALAKGWTGVQIVDGHPNMQKAAWIAACTLGIALEGFKPDMEAERTRLRVVSPDLPGMQTAIKQTFLK